MTKKIIESQKVEIRLLAETAAISILCPGETNFNNYRILHKR